MRASAFVAAMLITPCLSLAAGPGAGARYAEQFRRADADHNGMVSRAEAERAAPLLAKRFDAIDVRRDGRLSPEEIRAFRKADRLARRARGARAGAAFNRHFARADANGDGVLSRTEAERGLPRIAGKFERLDRDGDGRLTREEIRAWLAARRAARLGKGH